MSILTVAVFAYFQGDKIIQDELSGELSADQLAIKTVKTSWRIPAGSGLVYFISTCKDLIGFSSTNKIIQVESLHRMGPPSYRNAPPFREDGRVVIFLLSELTYPICEF
jgi:hypothetical protein